MNKLISGCPSEPDKFHISLHPSHLLRQLAGSMNWRDLTLVILPHAAKWGSVISAVQASIRGKENELLLLHTPVPKSAEDRLRQIALQCPGGPSEPSLTYLLYSYGFVSLYTHRLCPLLAGRRTYSAVCYYRQTIRSRYCPAVQFRLAKRSESDTDLASAFIKERLAERDQQENKALCITHRCSRTAINGLHTTCYGKWWAIALRKQYFKSQDTIEEYSLCRPHKTSFIIYREMYQVTYAQENINKAQGK